MTRKLKTPVHHTAQKWLYLLFLMLLGATPAFTQTIIPPSTPDKIFCPDPSGGVNLENALVDYYCNSGGQLMAVAWDAGSLGIHCVINDGINSRTVTINLPAGYTSYAGPNVVLGGDNATSPASTTFYLGIVYQAQDVSGNLDVFLQAATITNPGSPSFAVSSCGSSILLNTGAHTAINGSPRIDMITKDISGGTGPVDADRFVVSWLHGPSAGVITSITGMYCPNGLAYTAVNCVLPPATITRSITLPSGVGSMDVAGIERKEMGVFDVDDIALFTYSTGLPLGSTGSVYYQEWDMSLNTITTPLTVYTGCTGCVMPGLARIDAIDCNSQHDPVVTGLANYDIVFMTGTLPGIRTRYNIFSYNNLAGAYDCSNGSFVASDNLSPQVACGPGILGTPSTYQYNIAYSSNHSAGNTAYSQLINWNTGNLAPNNLTYRQVNTSPTSSSLPRQTAVSSSINNLVPDHVFVCWFDSTTGNINYKISASPVAYRPASVSSVTPAADWTLAPNPATDVIYLSTSATDVIGTTYSISDITGRAMQQAPVTGTRQQIAVRDLSPGMYILHIYAKGATLKTIKFVKE